MYNFTHYKKHHQNCSFRTRAVIFIHSLNHNSSHEPSLPNDIKRHCLEQAGSGGSEWMKPANKKQAYLPPPSPITVSGTWYSLDTKQDAITGTWSVWMLFLHFHELCEACALIPLPNLLWKQWGHKKGYESMCWLPYRVHIVHICILWII